jgi:hypothetical protein
VYRALDRVMGEAVALKVMAVLADRDEPRVSLVSETSLRPTPLGTWIDSA